MCESSFPFLLLLLSPPSRTLVFKMTPSDQPLNGRQDDQYPPVRLPGFIDATPLFLQASNRENRKESREQHPTVTLQLFLPLSDDYTDYYPSFFDLFLFAQLIKPLILRFSPPSLAPSASLAPKNSNLPNSFTALGSQ